MTEQKIAPEVLAAEAKELFDSAVEMLQQIERFDKAIIKAQRLAEEISIDIRSKEYRITDLSEQLNGLLAVSSNLNLYDHEVLITHSLLLALYDTERDLRLDYLKTPPNAQKDELLANNPISILLKKIIGQQERKPRFADLSLEQMALIIKSVRSKIESIYEELPQLQREIEEAETQQVALQDSLQEIQDNREKAVAEYRRLVGKLNNLESQLFRSETGLSQPESDRDQQQRRYLATLSQRVNLYQLTRDDVTPINNNYLTGSCSLHAEDGQVLLSYATINTGLLQRSVKEDNQANVISAAFDRIVPVGALFLRPVPRSDGQKAVIKLKGQQDKVTYGQIDDCGVFSSSR